MYSIRESVIQIDRLVQAIFREATHRGENQERLTTGRIFGFFLVVSPIYGVVMGSYSWVAGRRVLSEQWPQIIYSGIKLPLLIVATVVIALPSFCVFNRLLGLADDNGRVIESIFRSLASFAITLASLSPMTLFFYFAVGHYLSSYQWSVLLNTAIFGIAAICSQRSLWTCYEPLIRKNSQHRWGLRVWVITFAFVGIQAAWSLRPFIGTPDEGISFFRDEPFSNAYLAIIKIVRVTLG